MELSYLLDIILAFSLGMWVMDKIIYYRIRKSLIEAGVDFTEEKSVEVLKVKKYFIENIDGLLYLYEHTTNNFVGQGNTVEELAGIAKNKSKVAGVTYKEEVLWFVDGEVKNSI
jgi:hypothetical protein